MIILSETFGTCYETTLSFGAVKKTISNCNIESNSEIKKTQCSEIDQLASLLDGLCIFDNSKCTPSERYGYNAKPRGHGDIRDYHKVFKH